MAKVAVSFAESAIRDLEDIREWYESQSVPQVGRRVVAEIFERIEAVRDNPDMGRVVPEFGQIDLRELIHPPFRIVYKPEDNKARVVRVWRSERLLRVSADGE